ncbi:MAG TPA: hypothetical protein VLU41_16290 [Ideonella sp.]|nr:hypothetical protein [Ideonella sp.]
MLQTNIKRCTPAGDATDRRLEIAVARRYTDPPEAAQAVTFRFTVQAARPDFLSVTLAADEGPVGTRNYRLGFEAVPPGTRQTYEPGLIARMATRAYLASAGRDKVGFSIVGHDAQGRPLHVHGIGRRRAQHDALLPRHRRLPCHARRAAARAPRAAARALPRAKTGRAEYLAMKRREAP